MGTSASKDETDEVNFTPKGLAKNGQAAQNGHAGAAGGGGAGSNSSGKSFKAFSADESSIASCDTRDGPSYVSSTRKKGDSGGGRTGAVAAVGGGGGGTEEPGVKSKSHDSGGSARTGSTAASSTSPFANGGPLTGGTVEAAAGGHAATDVSSHVQDNDVQVNLAMADLMAYLQVVANNSSNLPLTRRDDPELGRTVSTLTADEYARKSAAFIPSDVRIIGGSFTRYGRVWDLPTSEEFSAADGAQEPGRSHGGACCNALLKVLYDAESENADEAKVDVMNPDNLFDDDDTTHASDVPHSSADERSTKSFESLVLADGSTTSNITWASLLRKMKEEMQETGFAQLPTITSSRKFDLNKPFSLVPSDFDPKKNKKRSLFIGCNYSSVPGADLKASHDDIRSVKDFIVNVHGFPETKGLMTVLLDDGEHKPPTHVNITEALKSLSEQSLPGDAVFVQFSGHGGRILDSPIDSETESYDEVLLPSDFSTAGVIRDTLFFKTLLAPMRYGVTVTCLVDACDTGVMIDLPYAWTAKPDRGADNVAKMSLNDDFSFVRFLKVIKTLYETSTFTMLGKTVGTALNEKAPGNPRGLKNNDDEESVNDDDTLGVGSLVTVDEDEEGPKMQTSAKSSILKVLAACSSPKTVSPTRKGNAGISDARSKGMSNAMSGPESRSTQSLFEQVMNCTFTNPADESDEDTFHADDHTLESEEGTFDTLNDIHTDEGDTGKAVNRRNRRR